MTTEVLQFLQPDRGGTFVDCTTGLGGHTRALCDGGAQRVIGFDRDAEALAIARVALASCVDRIELVKTDYRDIDAVLDGLDVRSVDVVLADLGLSSMQ